MIPMFYRLHELQRTLLDPLSYLAQATSKVLRDPQSPYSVFPGARAIGATQALFHRFTKRYEKPPFAIGHVHAHGREVVVAEEVVVSEPFCELVRFKRMTDDPALATRMKEDPKVLVCAPLSGHHATLLRDTVKSLLQDHDVYVTDWVDARDVPVESGTFSLDDYVHTIQRFVRKLGPRNVHVVSVCQPTVPVLAAISLMAQSGERTPRTLTLMGGPIDASKSPTAVNKLATDHPIEWFEKNLIHTVPSPHAGEGRRVYPGFLQLTAFVSMNPDRHAQAHWDYWFDLVKGAAGESGRAAHERFYDEYNAVLDMDAAYYLDTVRVVFQEMGLARGTWEVDGVRVRPEAIRETAIFTVEGENDDISGIGQTEAAHTLCSNVPEHMRKHHVAPGCGHYGIFSGRKWREAIYPQVRDFVLAHDADEELALAVRSAS
jgi:poly(3-hydroxybutyrate) depolymerase